MDCLAVHVVCVLHLVLLILAVGGGASAVDLSVKLGSVHWSPCYYVDPNVSVLVDGAAQVLAMGSRVIKVAAFDPEKNYKWNTQWQSGLTTPLKVLQSPQYAQLLSMPFDTFIFVVFSSIGDNYWLHGATAAQLRTETREIQEAAHFLLSSFPDGKNFVFQNWEGDWAVRGCYNASFPPRSESIDGMKKWYAARQRGVQLARWQVALTGRSISSTIRLAAEVNLVKHAMANPSFPDTLNSVIPFVEIDLVSYSNYDTFCDTRQFTAALKFITQQHRPTQFSPSPVPVYVGEVGMPLMTTPMATVQRCTKTAIAVALAFGVQHVMWWEMYNNECTNKTLCPDGNCRSAAAPVFNPADQRGFWLVAPNGTASWPREYIAGMIQNGMGGESGP